VTLGNKGEKGTGSVKEGARMGVGRGEGGRDKD